MDSCSSPLRKVVKVPDTHLKRDPAHIINIIKSERLAIQTSLHVASSNYSCIFDDEDHIIIQCDLETLKQCLLLYHAPNETKLFNVKPDVLGQLARLQTRSVYISATLLIDCGHFVIEVDHRCIHRRRLICSSSLKTSGEHDG